MNFLYLIFLLEFSVFSVPEPLDVFSWGSFDSTRVSAGFVLEDGFQFATWSSIILEDPDAVIRAVPELTEEHLSTLDAFVTPGVVTLWPNEKTRLLEWVEAGGVLVVLYEYYTVDTFNSNFQSFGFHATEVDASIRSYYDFPCSGLHPLLDGISTINAIPSVDIDMADKTLCSWNGQTQMAYTIIGSGVAVVIPYIMTIAYNIESADNRRFIQNLVSLAKLGLLEGCTDDAIFHYNAGRGFGVCCPISCGTCDGLACDKFPGGQDNCCSGTIIDSGSYCTQTKTAPCILSTPVCGNGILEPPEKCDDGNLIETDSCRNDCTPGYCGDGFVQPELCEECDDGNNVYGDGCNDCRVSCGDGVWDLDEECDFGSDPGCERDCTYGGAVWQLIKSEHMDPSIFSSASGDLRYFGTLAEEEYDIIEIWGGGYFYRFELDQVDLFEDTENLYIPITNFETNNKEMERLVNDADGAYFCRAASESQHRKPGDTSWAIVPKNDENRGCGCNSRLWEGRGVYYGGSNPASVCDSWGGGFAGFVENGEQKGGINIGVSIYGGIRESRAQGRGDGILVPAEISPECKAAGGLAEETRSEIPDDFFTRTTIIDHTFVLEGIEYQAGAVIDGNHVKIEGDIILGYAADIDVDSVVPSKKLLAFEIVGNAWTQCPIPYEIASTDPVQNENALAALAHFEENTLWSFVERTREDGWIKFVDGEGTFDCSSFVGRRPLARQPQEITNTGCSVGNLIHEIGHALGMHHEHMRPDRDDYIQIVQNTVDIMDPNFAIRQDDKAHVFGGYDLQSIMHYEDRTIVDNNVVSWFTSRGSVPYGVKIGQREGLSQLDIELANMRFQQVTGGECFPESVSCACPGMEFYVGQQVRASRDVEHSGVMISSGDIGRIVCGNELGLFIDWDGLQDGTGSTGPECEDSCGLSQGLRESTGGWAPCDAVRTLFVYEFVSDPRNAFDAELDCQSRGGHLANIHSEQDNEEVGALYDQKMWIGINDIVLEDDFVWTDGTPVHYTNWGVNQPDDGGHFANCVHIWKGSHGNTWADRQCEDEFPYVCSIPAAVLLDDDEVPSGERVDRCPSSSKLHPGICGCNRLDEDTDGDGILDCKEGCKNDYLRQTPPCKVACGDCGEAHKEAGCSVPEIVECVIHKMGKKYESCKTSEWDSYCADVATSECSCGE